MATDTATEIVEDYGLLLDAQLRATGANIHAIRSRVLSYQWSVQNYNKMRQMNFNESALNEARQTIAEAKEALQTVL